MIILTRANTASRISGLGLDMIPVFSRSIVNIPVIDTVIIRIRKTIAEKTMVTWNDFFVFILFSPPYTLSHEP